MPFAHSAKGEESEPVVPTPAIHAANRQESKHTKQSVDWAQFSGLELSTVAARTFVLPKQMG